MLLLDANILLYAVDETSPFHLRAKTWLEDALNGWNRPVAESTVAGFSPGDVGIFVVRRLRQRDQKLAPLPGVTVFEGATHQLDQFA